MTMLRRLLPLGFLLFAAGCAKSTAAWTEDMQSPNPVQRLHAVHALQERPGEKETVVPILTAALQDQDTYVRRDAAKALGQFGPEARAAVVPLTALLKDREPGVRKAAGQALKKIDPAVAAKAGVK
jgi:HEAT repeat protein